MNCIAQTQKNSFYRHSRSITKMPDIISVQNPLIKKVHSLQQKKNRIEQGLFLIEGFKGLEEAFKSGLEIENIFIQSDSNKFEQIKSDFPQENIYTVNENILRKISTTESPPEVVATAKQLKYSIKDMFLSDSPLIIVLESIKDPGNLGTIIRTAKAGWASGIILTDEAVDIYNPKTVRASAFNLWKIPIISLIDKPGIKEIINKYKQCQFIATTVATEKNSVIYYDINYREPTVILLGSESQGLSQELKDQSDKLAIIPMSNEVESLNLSISVGVILYEAVRQRKYSG